MKAHIRKVIHFASAIAIGLTAASLTACGGQSDAQA
jgi:hypothetical protein